jgi:hypothetical protein
MFMKICLSCMHSNIFTIISTHTPICLACTRGATCNPPSLTHFRPGVTEVSIMFACAEFGSDNEVAAELGQLASLVATFGAGGAVQALRATLRAALAKKP